MISRRLRLFSFLVGLMALTPGCQGTDSATSSLSDPETTSVLPDTSQIDPQNPSSGGNTDTTPSPTPSGSSRTYTTDVLLYNGSGVSTSDWQTTEEIVKSQGLTYQLVNATQLNAMTVDQMANFGLMIVPGGSGGTITSGIDTATRLRVRQAVRERGLSYLGFCAGAWIAVGPEAETSNVASYGLALAKGSVLSLYLPGGKSPTAAIVDVTFADQSQRNLVWWGGPATPEWKNGVIARYEDGEAAISETQAGKGYVIVSGPHPEAPQGWRSTAGNDPDGLDYDIAIKLILAALHQQPLATF